MSRTAPVTQAVSARRKARATPSSSPEPASLTFGIDEDNGGGYHWTMVADGREMLVRSARFGSYEEANEAAGIVKRGASRASFEERSGSPSPIDLSARRGAASHEDSDAERWLDEGGSFSGEAVTR